MITGSVTLRSDRRHPLSLFIKKLFHRYPGIYFFTFASQKHSQGDSDKARSGVEANENGGVEMENATNPGKIYYHGNELNR